AEAGGRAARPVAGVAGEGGGGVRLPRRGLDDQAGGGGHPARVRGALSPRAHQPAVAPGEAERAEAHPTGESAGRGDDRGVAGPDLARPSSKAREEGRTILFADEAAFYLLPFVARTYAPRGQTPILRAPLTPDHRAPTRAPSPDCRPL